MKPELVNKAPDRDVKIPFLVNEFNFLKSFLSTWYMEGIVWANPDGRFAKLRRDDLGFGWGSKKLR